MVIVPMLLLAALGAALGYVREPTYTAQSQLAVGELNIDNPSAIGSVVAATESLASVYARRIDATEVRQDIREEIRGAPASANISATSVPDSPIVRISAESSDRGTAIRVANSGAEALVAHANELTDPSATSDRLFERYRTLSLRASEQAARYRRLRRAFGRAPGAADQRTLDRVLAELETTRLRRDGLRLQFQTSQQTARSSPALRTFALARGASSDRRQAMQILVLLGLIAGAAIGTALATFRLNRRVARLTRP